MLGGAECRGRGTERAHMLWFPRGDGANLTLLPKGEKLEVVCAILEFIWIMMLEQMTVGHFFI